MVVTNSKASRRLPTSRWVKLIRQSSLSPKAWTSENPFPHSSNSTRNSIRSKATRGSANWFHVWGFDTPSPGAAEFHVGPHLMIVTPHQDELQGLNRDGSTGMPYVAHLPNRTELYLVMPIRQWDER